MFLKLFNKEHDYNLNKLEHITIYLDTISFFLINPFIQFNFVNELDPMSINPYKSLLQMKFRNFIIFIMFYFQNINEFLNNNDLLSHDKLNLNQIQFVFLEIQILNIFSLNLLFLFYLILYDYKSLQK